MKQNQDYPTYEEITKIVSLIEDAKLYAQREYWECSKLKMEKATKLINFYIHW